MVLYYKPTFKTAHFIKAFQVLKLESTPKTQLIWAKAR
jgi:hypothetical protein